MAALWDAVVKGDEIEVEQWLLQGADPNHRAGATQQMPVLHVAAELGHVPIIGALVLGGASIHAVDGEGWSAFMLAADCGHVEAVRKLCAAGADVNARAQILKSPLCSVFVFIYIVDIIGLTDF